MRAIFRFSLLKIPASSGGAGRNSTTNEMRVRANSQTQAGTLAFFCVQASLPSPFHLVLPWAPAVT
eukprot:3215409-Amphidinium_carterae.1